MVNIKWLLKQSIFFYKKAYSNQNDIIIKQMIGLAIGAIVSVKHLLSLPEHKGSKNLLNVLDGFDKINQELHNININDPSFSLDSLKELLGNVSFYADHNNSGTGYDPAMDHKKDGYTEPSYYVKQITHLWELLKNNIYNVNRF